MTKNIVSNNCQIPIPDCFNKNGLPQLGVNPFNEPPTLSELAFVNRYGGSKNRTIHNRKKTNNNRKTTTNNRKKTTNNRKTTTNNRKTTTNNRKKTTNNGQKTTKNKKTKMRGGVGYYLKLDDLINNMPVVKSYDSCCPPLFDGKLLTNKI